MFYLSLLPPPLAVGSARSPCCSRFICFCAFCPLTLTLTPSASHLLVLFLFFLPPAALMSPSLPLPCCGRRLSSLYGWFVAGLPSSSGHPVTGVLLQRLASWALQCYFPLCRQRQFLCYILSHFLSSFHSPCLWASPSELP